MCRRRHIRREKNPPHFPPAFFRLSSKDGVTAESVTGDRDPSILRVVGILIFDVFFYLTLLNGDSPPGGVKIHIRQPGDRDGTSSVVSSRIWVFCRSHDLHANSLAIVMGHLSLSYRLLGSFRSFIMKHEPSINDRMSVSRLFKGHYGYKSNVN